MRVFIAIELSDELKLALTEIVLKLKKSGADVRWVNVQGMHLTLKFLGEVDAQKELPGIEQALAETSAKYGSFKLVMKGTGVFPERGRPRVFWMGFSESAELLAIQADIESRLAGLGFMAEARPFRAHLTLGRVKGPAGLQKAVTLSETWKEKTIGTLDVNRLILYQSILRPKGAEYKIVKDYSLQ